MRTATTVEFSTDVRQTTEFVVEAEKLGLDECWVAEAWGSDAPSALGFLAARTEKISLGSGIIQTGTRTPALLAMTAMTLAELTDGRFKLGLGSSGPQVIEGVHGRPFARPLTRLKETVDVLRQAFAGEKLRLDGKEFTIPLPGGEGKPMRLSLRTEAEIPLYVAALSPKTLEFVGAQADGWLGTSFVPEGAAAYFEPLGRGLAAAGRDWSELDVCQGAEVNFARDEAELKSIVDSRKGELAFSLGGMGTASTNFYNDAYSRQGWDEVAAQVRDRWQRKDFAGATTLITDEMVLATTLIGTEDGVRERLRVWRDAGVNTVRLYPAGETSAAKLATLGRAIDLVRGLDPVDVPSPQ